MKLGIWLWGGMLLGASCSQESAQPELPAGTPVRVTADLRVSICPITPVVAPATRGEDDANSKSLRVDYVQPDATRSDMSAAEKEIKNAYVVQFNGTSSTSTAVSVSADVSAQLKSGLPVSHNFTLTSGVKNRVYVVANLTTAPTVGMTLQAFEKVSYTVSTLPSTGLPMVAHQDVALGETFNLFELKSPLAKLTFKTNVGTLTLKGIPSAYSLIPATAGSDAMRPSGVTYTNTATLTSGTSYYVPANLSGRNSEIPNYPTRALGFASTGAMYVAITNNGTIYNVLLGDGSVQDFNVAGNYSYSINATINGVNEFCDLRVGNPIPANSKLVDLVKQLSNATANCYIVPAANTWYSFDATVMGNGKATPLPANLDIANSVASAITPAKLSPASAEVLWETFNNNTIPHKGSVIANNVYLLKDRLLFYGGSTEGNAVIAVKDASGTIIWSWHIWLTNSTPSAQTLSVLASTSGKFDATGTTTLFGLEIMDRNLGALSDVPQDDYSVGMYYQWGRKDPMPGAVRLENASGAMVTQPAGIPVILGFDEVRYTVAQSIAQPTTFPMGGDWCSTRNDNLWGTPLTGRVTINNGDANVYNSNSGSKSIYDPCPVGWRVPPGYVFANVSKKKGGIWNAGYSFSILTSDDDSWFPASGFRGGRDGFVTAVEWEGYYWSSSPNTIERATGNYLVFDIYSAFPLDDNFGSRNAGYSVRCSKE